MNVLLDRKMSSVTKTAFFFFFLIIITPQLSLSPHILLSVILGCGENYFCAWLKSAGWHPRIQASFKLQNKGRFFHNEALVSKECFLKKKKKLASLQEKQPSFFPNSSHLKTWSQLALKQNNFHTPRSHCFVILRKASFYHHSRLKLPNNPEATAFSNRALPPYQRLVFTVSRLTWPFILKHNKPLKDMKT